MKIIYLHQYFNTPEMSGGTRSYEMARRLVEWGHEVHIITSWRDSHASSNWFHTQEHGVNVYWLPVPYSNSMNFWQRIWAFFKFAIGVIPCAIKIGGDVVFATSTPLTIALPGAVVSQYLKVPMVFEVRDLWPEVPIAMGFLRNPIAIAAARWLERFAYRRAARVVALSDGMADGIVATGYPREWISVIPNGSDLELFAHNTEAGCRFRSAHPELGSGPIILYPGTLGKVNRVSYLAHLAHNVLAYRPDLKFVVIGGGAEEVQTRCMAEKLGVLGVNYFQYPPVAKRELVDAFSAASVIISLCVDEPALRANSANKFFDGLASGTPVAINYLGWQAKLLQESKAGVVLPSDPGRACEVLLNFMGSSDVMEASGQQARILAENRFARDILARNLESVLKSVVANSV